MAKLKIRMPLAGSARSPVVGGFRFMVEIDGMLAAGFSEVSGLALETEFEEVSEGGLNHYTHRLPKRTKTQPLVLRRGLTVSNTLWEWYSGVIDGRIMRKSGSIILMSDDYRELRRWNFYDAYPYKWTGPELNASNSAVAVEAVERVHNCLKAV